MVHRKHKLLASAIIAGGMLHAAHAQMAQDPLLSRTAAVEPSIVFMMDDSSSMTANAIYQFGGSAGVYGLTGPGSPSMSGDAIGFPARSPDVNRLYYDPRVTYSRRINANGTFQAAGATGSISSFNVYFYKPAALANTYSVNAVNVVNKGANYPASGITATFPVPPAGGTRATATIQVGTSPDVGTVAVTSRGSGYPSAIGAVTVAFSAPPAGGTTATGTVQTGSSSTVTGINVTARGRNYPATGVTATFTAPTLPGGVTATGNVVMDSSTNQVSDATANNLGSGYTSAPTVAFTAPPAGGTTATGTAVLTSATRLNNITVTSGGCYTTGGTVTVTGGGVLTPSTAPTVTPVYAGTAGSCTGGRRAITGFTVTGGTFRYTGIPTITVSAAGTAGSFTAVMTAPSNVVTDVTITDPGSGYTSTPTINFSGGGGTGASFTAVMAPNYRIGSITMTNAGHGYTSPPTITINTPSTGIGGAAVVSTTGTTYGITGITVTNGGSGYTSAPTLAITTATGSGAAFSVTLGTTNVISGVNVTNSGSGYTSTPTLILSALSGAAPGSGASFSYTYNTIVNQPDNRVWDGTDTPTGAANFFNPYTPDSASPLAAGASVISYPNVANSSTTAYPKFRNRTDCAGATSCTWAEELQNYANWKTYHSNRLDLAKTGIGLAFQPLNPTFRLGWGKINSLDTGSTSTLDKGVRLYNPTVQGEFLTWLYGISETALIAGTPNRKALDAVGTYYQRVDDNGPWANTPNGNGAVTSGGAEVTSHASCRRAYAMLMTDGYYNDSFSMTDTDTVNGTTITNPTSYQYKPIGPYSDTRSGTRFNDTFADVAHKYWVNDLRPNLGNNVRTVNGDEAYWQHLNFYAIGLGVEGTLDASDPAVLASLTGNSSTSPPRTRDWLAAASNDPKSIDDMWHATVNGRGKLLNAKTSDELNASIQKMMSDISGKEGTQSGVAVSTASLTKDTKKYTPSYTPISWNGNVTAYSLDPSSGNQVGIAWQVETLIATDPITGAKSYSSLIPAASTRNIYVGNGATSGAVRAVPFTYADMNPALTASMNGTVNAGLIDYLRGDPTNEDTSASSSSSTAIYRARSTRLADIVNSTPVFVKDSIDLNYDLGTTLTGRGTYRAFVAEKKARAEGLLFVGANDGMMHAFRDGTYDPNTGAVVNQGGIETFAYVPNALLPSLNLLADKTYVHRFYVDGPHIETDAYFGSGPSTSGWRNIVIGTTGAGAGVASSAGVSPRTAVYAIDVTSLNSSPTSLSATNVLWEVNSTNAAFAELGYVLTDVQAGPTKDGSWVAIFGNGYESKSCKASLFVVDLKTGAFLRELQTNTGACTSSATKNGLGGVRIVRDTGGTIIGAYAGDLLGNVWKFSLNDAVASNWKVDYKLFTAGATQPITAAPGVLTLPLLGTPVPPPITGQMVVVGTGKFYEVSDITNNAVQSLYGIWDPVVGFGGGGTTLANTSLMVQQTIGAAATGVNGNTYYPISTNAVDYDLGGKRGWFINLPNTGQRLVYPIDFLSGRFATADTISPSNVSLDPCSNLSGGTGYFYIIDALTGAGPTEAVLDTNGDGNVDSSDLVVSGLEGKADGRNVTLEVSKNASRTTYVNVSGGAPGGTLITISCKLTGTCLPPPGTGGGPTSKVIKSREWRQLFMR